MATNYVGETYRIRTGNETDFDGETLDPGDVASVQVQVFVSDFSETVLDEPMTYDSNTGHWFSIWDTAGIEAGTYKAMIQFQMLDGSIELEGPQRIRLKIDPRP